MLESKFKTALIAEIKTKFPGCFVFHLDPTEYQGIPDILILYENRWAALEGKRGPHENVQPNQEYYVDRMNQMSFAAFIYPENREEVMHDLQEAFNL